MRITTLHQAANGKYHAGTHESCVLCYGAKPCTAHPLCTGVFLEEWKVQDYTGWRYLPEDKAPVHDCVTGT